MHIASIEARKFRNLDDVHCDLDTTTTVFVGQNGQGKTNILEALYVCATGKSFRQASPKELVQHGEQSAKLRAVFVRDGVRHDVEVGITPKRRTMRVDGRVLKRTSSLLELLNVVAFFPDDLRIIKGGPEQRRRFLDRAVANAHSSFVDISAAYGKVLKARNALLRQDHVDQALVHVYDTQLVEHGQQIHSLRCETIATLHPDASKLFHSVTRQPAELGFELSRGFEAAPDPSMSYGDAFGIALKEGYPQDRARGATSVGPHRSDVIFELGGQSARAYASQGQQRAIVLALKLAEVEQLAHKHGDAPILLLDDVSSELDKERNAALFGLLERLGSQILVSTTGAAPLPLHRDALVCWRVDRGILNSMSSF